MAVNVNMPRADNEHPAQGGMPLEWYSIIVLLPLQQGYGVLSPLASFSSPSSWSARLSSSVVS
jgi:hypothetical protein